MVQVTQNASGSYVLVTAAYNEEKFIGTTIEAVIAQSKRPVRWVIVSDGSTDRTASIVDAYCRQHDFIDFLPLTRNSGRGTASKVNALQKGFRRLEGLEYNFVGNLDADVSFRSTYFADLLDKFAIDSRLGLAGGIILERQNGQFRPRPTNNLRSVAHAAQLVRRECYEAIGGYLPLKHGGEDWCAEISARMLGWRVQSFSDLEVLHYRPTGSAAHPFRNQFREGRMDFALGSVPSFELLKCLRRIGEKPMVLGAVVRWCGFCWPYLRGEQRAVSESVVSYLQREQRQRLRELFVHAAPVSDE
jgi:Glycosyl transferase family 2